MDLRRQPLYALHSRLLCISIVISVAFETILLSFLPGLMAPERCTGLSIILSTHVIGDWGHGRRFIWSILYPIFNRCRKTTDFSLLSLWLENYLRLTTRSFTGMNDCLYPNSHSTSFMRHSPAVYINAFHPQKAMKAAYKLQKNHRIDVEFLLTWGRLSCIFDHGLSHRG